MNSLNRGDAGSVPPLPGPAGIRRLTAPMLRTESVAETFEGLADGDAGPSAVLAAFKAAAPYLGLPGRIVGAIDWLFKFTKKQDWAPGSRPIVWPSAAVQCEELGISGAQAKRLNRTLTEYGLVVMRDSPNGKRYGKRDRTGQILVAYGFDLSPLGARIEEFLAVVEEARARREALKALRRRATIAHKRLQMIAGTAAEHAVAGQWDDLVERAAGARDKVRRAENVEAAEALIQAMEATVGAAQGALQRALDAKISVDMSPTGRRNEPHQYNYKPETNPKKDYVTRIEGSSSPGGGADGGRADLAGSGQVGRTEKGSERAGRTDRGTALRLRPDELVELAPRLKRYLMSPSPNWVEIVEAADWLRGELGVSKPLWGEACLAMGRERAAIALAVLSTKPAGHFRTSPGGYFFGMVAKARAGELNLDRTIWGIRKGALPSPAGSPEIRQ